VVVDEHVPVLSFTFGIPSLEGIGELFTIGTATTVAEAAALESAGVHAVIAQGFEAGGHRGTFLAPVEQSLVGTLALVPQMVDALSIPVIASGGIMDGRGIAAALTLGADAVQLGTAFLLCPEAGTSAPYRDAVAAASEADTTITLAFSGRAARGLRNRMSDELASATLPPYPVMNALTRPLRRAAAAAGRSEFLSLWAGRGVPMARSIHAGELVAALERETDAALAAKSLA
jgi:nitronate monooxygenase